MSLVIQTSIKKVTVYTDRAIISRQHQQDFEVGKFEIKIENLPLDLVDDSLRVSGQGLAAAKISDVKVRTEFHDQTPHEELARLEKELASLKAEKSILQQQVETLQYQKEFVLSVKDNTAQQNSQQFQQQQRIDLAQMQSVLQFVGENLGELHQKMFGIQQEIKQLSKKQDKIKFEIQQLSAAQSQERKAAFLELEVSEAGSLELEISYLTHRASWHPVYDARVDSAAKKVTLEYFGMVRQHTAEDWTDVEVLLSTARPHIGGNPPSLSPWYIKEQSAHRSRRRTQFMDRKVGASAPPAAPKKTREEGAFGGMAENEKPLIEDQTTVEAGQGTSVVFKTPGKNLILGDNSLCKIKIMSKGYDADFQYFTVPKLSDFVYLTAEVTNDSDYPLLSGKINIFLDENFVGNTALSEVITPSETFDLYLGVDESIKVKHDFSKKQRKEKGLFSKEKGVSYQYQIRLKNHRDTPEKITIWGQLPVSQHEKIKVQTITISPEENPKKDKSLLPQGTLEWNLTLAAQEEKNIELEFLVQYPADFAVHGL